MENLKSLLEDVVTVEVLLLAKSLKGDKSSTSDYTQEAVRLLRQKQPEILRLLRQT